MKPRTLMTTLALGGGCLALAGVAFGDDDDRRCTDRTTTLAVYGDAPYGTSPTDDSETLATPAFVAAVNADRAVDLVLHVGDIHSGKQYCTEAYDRAIFDLWTAFDRPLVYTPGDNEWTDCHKPGEGGNVLDGNGAPVDYANGDPVANLDLVRSIFFARPGRTLGRHPMHVTSQAHRFDRRHPNDTDFVENVIWEASDVTFVTINLPGGSNNDQDVWYGAAARTAAQDAEIADRTGADLRWLDAAFERARDRRSAAVVIALQADMWDPEKGVAHQAGYEPFVASLATHARAFGKPVLLLDGDSHVYRSDNPLAASDPLAYMHPGYDVANFHRIVVHGSTAPLEYLRLTIDPRTNAPASATAFGPFRWERVTAP